MPRIGRVILPNYPHHVVQLGHNRQVVFAEEAIADFGQLMKRLTGRQTRFVNRQESRSGTLWEGRYKSSPIDTDAYLLACCRYVEPNPVRAGMTDSPDSYP